VGYREAGFCSRPLSQPQLRAGHDRELGIGERALHRGGMLDRHDVVIGRDDERGRRHLVQLIEVDIRLGPQHPPHLVDDHGPVVRPVRGDRRVHLTERGRQRLLRHAVELRHLRELGHHALRIHVLADQYQPADERGTMKGDEQSHDRPVAPAHQVR